MLKSFGADSRAAQPGLLLKSGVSALALCALAFAGPAYAQPQAQTDTPSPQGEDGANPAEQAEAQGTAPDTGEAIVVTGIRQSLANSQNIKRQADTVVDAITAEDIGALPDRSVTEALQRVPGVSINRFAGSNDPDHFSVEGSGVVVRGLSYVRSEFNGRDTFSTGVYGQAINFSDVPAELLGSVEVYKNLTAEMIEGGLSGIVNLNTRTPFQRPGFHIGFDIQGQYGDMREEWSPTGSLLISNTWDTGAGRFGLLANVSYSEVLTRADGIQVTNFQRRDNQLGFESQTDVGNARRCRNALPLNTNTRTLPPTNANCGTQEGAGPDGFADWADLRYAPLGGQFRTQEHDRERFGIALAGQWESTDRRARLTAQFIRSESTSRSREYTFESAPDLSEYNTFPYGCRPNQNGPYRILPDGTPDVNGRTTRAECPLTGQLPLQNYQYDENGVFERGYITLPGNGWRSVDSGSTWRTPTGGIQQQIGRGEVDDENVVADYGLNFRFTPDDRWQFNADAQYVSAEHNNLDLRVFGATFADQELDLTGDLPSVIPHRPLWLSADWSGCTPAAGMPGGTCTPNTRINGQNDTQFFSDRANYFFRAAMDHMEESRGEELAFRGDVAYNFDEESFIRRVKFGARYADRQQNLRFTTYNWGVISETWGGTGPVWMDNAAVGQNVSFYEFPDFFRGQTSGPPGGWYYNGSLIDDYEESAAFFRSLNAVWNGGQGWVPVGQRPGAVDGYLPGDLQNVNERNAAAYLMASFGRDDMFGDIDLEGNIGVRFVNTNVTSEGAISFPTQSQAGVQQPFSVRCAPRVAPSPPADPGTIITPGGVCSLGEAGYNQVRQFANGAVLPQTAENSYTYWLPSLNIKLGITEELIARFAASRAMARPGMADLRLFTNYSINFSDPQRLQGTTGNPFLRPAISDQFDLTLEWYFARVGSLTFNAFYKDISNYFYQAVREVQLTNNGITRTVAERYPENFDGSGEVKGFEIAYQQTFDFLPGPLSGLGVSASYTHIDSEGIPLNRPGTGPGADLNPQRLPMEQMSRHNVNAAVFYENGPISLRAAYNWRSRFLLTAADVIHPFYPIFNAPTGQLDASAFYSITDNIRVGVQAVNLLNEVTKTEQMFSDDGLIGPRSYFMNDRRFSFILRGSF